ncbi:MAG: nucleotidyltransferase family protein [Paracoccaceae bacterium]
MKIEVILLAAGASRRMRGEDKLLREIDGEALLRRAARAAVGSKVGAVHVVLAPGADAHAHAKVLDGLAVEVVVAEDWREGMAASLRAGMAAVSSDCDAVVVALADMPEVSAADYDRLIGAFDASGSRIFRAVDGQGAPGHPVLFGSEFFAALTDLHGDRGARDIVRAAGDKVHDVVTGAGAVIDLDTPEDWAAWQSGR